jgi:general L-amino acid transport system substrate-binding protein
LRRVIFSFSLLGAVFVASSVHGGVAERVKTEGALRCGSTERPGLAEPDLAAPVGNVQWLGLNVEMCRAIAIAVFGPAGRFEFHRYETQKDYDAVRQGTDAVFFLTASEIIAQNLSAKLIPGPTVYYETHALMVKANSAAQRLEDLKGARICFVIGSGAQRSLESFFEARQLAFLRLAFSEEHEMADAYRAGRCDAVAEEVTALARLRLQEGVKANRVLPQPLAVFPVMVCTAIADGQWAAIAAWTLHTLIRADIHEGSWRADGAKALAIDGAGLGLGQGWQKQIIDTLGGYGDMYRRTLGDQSIYGLARGLNAPSLEGGLFAAPYSE